MSSVLTMYKVLFWVQGIQGEEIYPQLQAPFLILRELMRGMTTPPTTKYTLMAKREESSADALMFHAEDANRPS